jgi:hypothetical protein
MQRLTSTPSTVRSLTSSAQSTPSTSQLGSQDSLFDENDVNVDTDGRIKLKGIFLFFIYVKIIFLGDYSHFVIVGETERHQKVRCTIGRANGAECGKEYTVDRKTRKIIQIKSHIILQSLGIISNTTRCPYILIPLMRQCLPVKQPQKKENASQKVHCATNNE